MSYEEKEKEKRKGKMEKVKEKCVQTDNGIKRIYFLHLNGRHIRCVLVHELLKHSKFSSIM